MDPRQINLDQSHVFFILYVSENLYWYGITIQIHTKKLFLLICLYASIHFAYVILFNVLTILFVTFLRQSLQLELRKVSCFWPM